MFDGTEGVWNKQHYLNQDMTDPLIFFNSLHYVVSNFAHELVLY